MAPKLGPLFSIFVKARQDWTSTLKDSETQLIVENSNTAFLIEVMNISFRQQLLEQKQEQWIFLAQVLREGEEILYAFESPQERSLFEELRNIDSVGPKSAALLVGRLGLNGFKELLENPKNFSKIKIPGLGSKSMEKISLGLKQKKEKYISILGNLSSKGDQGNYETFNMGEDSRLDLEKALTQLGLKNTEAKELFQKMCNENSAYIKMPLPQLIQEALRWWGRGRSTQDLSL